MFNHMSVTSVLYLVAMSGLYSLAVLALLVALLVEFILRRKAMRRYIGYGLLFGGAALGLDILCVVLEPKVLQTVHICILVPVDLLVFAKVGLCACMGMYCCASLGQVDMPWLRRLAGRAGPPSPAFWKGALAVAATALWGLGLTWLLFSLTHPQISTFLRNFLRLESDRSGIGTEMSPMLVTVMIAFAVGEEVLFRLGLQNYLALRFGLRDKKYWIAVVLTTAVWTIGHANALDPEWVKMVQIFALGVPLGFLFRRFGLESCIVAHGAFNVLALYMWGSS